MHKSKHKQIRGYLFELRWAVSWMWFLPMLLVLLVIFITRATYNPPLDMFNRPVGKAIGPDYATAVRLWLELFLPLIVVFLTNPLLAQEWQRGTLTQLALRKRLCMALAERLLYIFGYLVLVISAAVWLSMGLTTNPPGDGNWWHWTWQVLLTVLPTTIFLTSVALVVTHTTVNMTGGYVVTVSFWLANLLMAPLLMTDDKRYWLMYDLFSWTYRTIPENSDWQVGKFMWLGLALLLLLMQGLLLRHEARLVSSLE